MTALARPKKNGLSYFPLDVDFFEDPKIKILRARYGRDGIVFYIYLLCEIYKQGYYIQVDDDFEYIISDDLKMDQNKAKQVLNFLLSRSLFDNTLFQSDKVLTSAGIQRRFQLAVKERARKNPIEVGRFWLLKKGETEPFIKCTIFEDSSRKSEGFSGKNDGNSAEESLKKSKVNKSIYNTGFSPELERAFQMYLLVRKKNFGEIEEEQIQALRDDLLSLSDNEEERIAIVKKATASGWKSFYKTEKKRKDFGVGKGKKINNNNFERRKYDFEALESELIG
ncbi:DUF4373 domain-containing protein [[Ruminococcus] torques]|uniref:DUF4373 domain-containing protein n=1 Tax=[Ruminococcus] torques TaxID=33039 RepID=UPI00265D9CAB|nr:DUF4373 domain-containing protein [[Ruminococcus] torques]